MAALLKEGLEREGYAVDMAGTGEDAIRLVGENAYDAIVLDVILGGEPRLDGFAVCQQIRAAECRAPVLMVTAHDGVQDRVQSLDSSADDSPTRPLSLPQLLARTRALTWRGAGGRPAVLQAGDLSLNPARHEVERGGNKIGLTPTEFALLEFLMRHAGDVLTKTKLVEHVWDHPSDVDPRILKVYVRSLRDKIDRPFGRATIQTVWGIGYQIRDDTPGQSAD